MICSNFMLLYTSTIVNKCYQISSISNLCSLSYPLIPQKQLPADAMQYDILQFNMYLPNHVYPFSGPYVCEVIVYGNVNVLNCHCERNGFVAGNIIKTQWLGRLKRFSSSLYQVKTQGDSFRLHTVAIMSSLRMDMLLYKCLILATSNFRCCGLWTWECQILQRC